MSSGLLSLPPRKSGAALGVVFGAGMLWLGLLCAPCVATAQAQVQVQPPAGSAASPAPAAKAAASAVKANGKAITRPLWSELTPAQQQALAPLSRHWNTVSEAQKRKWLALSENYPKMSRRRAGQAAQPHDRVGGAQPPAAYPGAPELRRNQAVVARRQEGQVGGLPGAVPGRKTQTRRRRAAKPPATGGGREARGPRTSWQPCRRRSPRPETKTPRIASTPDQVDHNTLLPQQVPASTLVPQN